MINIVLKQMVMLMALSAMLVPFSGVAQTYPVKLVRLVVLFPPGGGVDVTARILAQQRPGQRTYGAAHGETIHMTAELMKLMAKIDIPLIPYKGEGPAIVDAMGGQVMFVFSNMQVSLLQVQGGRLRALGVTSAQHVPSLPNEPAIGESGLPGYEAATWFGMFSPAAASCEIIARLNADAVAGLNTPEVKERMAGQG